MSVMMSVVKGLEKFNAALESIYAEIEAAKEELNEGEDTEIEYTQGYIDGLSYALEKFYERFVK